MSLHFSYSAFVLMARAKTHTVPTVFYLIGYLSDYFPLRSLRGWRYAAAAAWWMRRGGSGARNSAAGSVVFSSAVGGIS